MHIGQHIQQVAKRQGRTVVWMARELNMVRSNLYDVFRRENIDTALLLRISKLLNHNFFQDIADKL